MGAWALDLGTTNTGVARWDEDHRRPEIVELPAICRRPGGASLLSAPRMIPSALEVLPLDWKGQLGAWGWVQRRAFVGVQGVIGQPALARNDGLPSPAFCPSFKSLLARDPMRPAARLRQQLYSARDVARIYLRELFAAIYAQRGERVRDLTVTVPVDSYERYRAEIRAALAPLGMERLRFLDEPVAAAIGYGLSLQRDRVVLVFDMGGGTLHAAVVRLRARGVEAGEGEVLAKQGRAVGGNLVDQWLLAWACQQVGVRVSEAPEEETEVLWHRLMIAEARRVKEALHFKEGLEEAATLTLTAPEELRGMQARLQGRDASVSVSRAALQGLLRERGLYALVEEAVSAVVAEAGVPIEEVLLIGGSTLLPGVYAFFEERFGRDRVRAWHPFEAVTMGAAVFAGGALLQADYLVHDYALQTHHLQTGRPEYTVLIPAGTKIPTAPDHWRQLLTPTCPLGEPETTFKLVIYELGRARGDERRFGWDATGSLRALAGEEEVQVPLNLTNPTLGALNPPHPPGDHSPRLEVCFGVDADRWLIATVRDLKAQRVLMQAQPVVRVL